MRARLPAEHVLFVLSYLTYCTINDHSHTWLYRHTVTVKLGVEGPSDAVAYHLVFVLSAVQSRGPFCLGLTCSLLSYLYPARNKELVEALAKRKASAIGMDCIPRTIRCEHTHGRMGPWVQAFNLGDDRNQMSESSCAQCCQSSRVL